MKYLIAIIVAARLTAADSVLRSKNISS
jgi:hypothetical protein